MKRLIWLSLAIAAASAPVSAQDSAPKGIKDSDVAILECYLRAQTVEQFELCHWLEQVADGQPTAWLEWRHAGWR